MRITRYTHSCVRLEHEDRVLVIDPGIWSEPRARKGADAVLVTAFHDAQVNERGLASLNEWLSEEGGTDHRWLPGIDVLRRVLDIT